MTTRAIALTPRQYRFFKGTNEAAPLLVPLVDSGADLRILISFCRTIFPGAPILALRTGEALRAAPEGPNSMLIDRINGLLTSAVARYDLNLVPVVLIGHEEGATLAARFAQTYGQSLAACILLRPTRSPESLSASDLDGLCVLLCGTSGDTGRASLALQLQKLLVKAGAQVIYQSTRRGGAPGRREAALCRVFLEALFGCAS